LRSSRHVDRERRATPAESALRCAREYRHGGEVDHVAAFGTQATWIASYGETARAAGNWLTLPVWRRARTSLSLRHSSSDRTSSRTDFILPPCNVLPEIGHQARAVRAAMGSLRTA
jgi:hypothetical protein